MANWRRERIFDLSFNQLFLFYFFFFQLLDINWTGLTNMLDIPGVKSVNLTGITRTLYIFSICNVDLNGQDVR